MEKAGFVNVKADDRTDLFVESLEKELVRTETIKDDFVKVTNQQGLITLISYCYKNFVEFKNDRVDIDQTLL